MNINKLFQYIKENLDGRLKIPYVSQDYTPEEKEKFYAGIHVALLNADKELTEKQIIEVFNSMKSETRANMKFPTRKGSVAFLTEDSSLSEKGLLELLEWSEKHQSGYGPRLDLSYNNYREHFKTIKEMRDHFGNSSNDVLAKRLFADIKGGKYRLTYIPPFDSLNPLIDLVNLTLEETYQQQRMLPILAQYEIFDAVQPKFQSLIADFNKIKSPSLVDIASFIKSMILLHPFPDGNGRTFTLGILNQVLLKNKLGICLNLDPRIALLSNVEIAQSIEVNLINLEQFELEETKQQKVAVQENQQEMVNIETLHTDVEIKPIDDVIPEQKTMFSQDINEKKISNLLTLSKSYLLHLTKEILDRIEDRSIDLEKEFLNADPEHYNHQTIFKLTLKKYQAVATFCRILEGEEKAEDKLILFKQDIIKNKELLATRRDSAAMTFLKGVLTLITVGIAAYIGIWGVKGQKFGEKVEEEITRPVLAYYS